MNVGTVGNDIDDGFLDPTTDENPTHGTRDGDDARRTTVLPARRGTTPQRKVDPSRGDEWDGRAKQSERSEGDRMSGVRVDDVHLHSTDHPAQSPRRPQIQFSARSAVDDFQPFGSGANRQWLTNARRDQRSMTGGEHRPREPEHLTLSTPPSSLGIDVQHSQGTRAVDPLHP